MRDGEGWPSRERVTTRSEIARVRADGVRVRGAVLEARVAPGAAAVTRVGVVVPKYGHGSVERNRLKRRVRDFVRREALPAWRALAPADVLIRALPVAYARSGPALREELRGLARRIAKARASATG